MYVYSVMLDFFESKEIRQQHTMPPVGVPKMGICPSEYFGRNCAPSVFPGEDRPAALLVAL